MNVVLLIVLGSLLASITSLVVEITKFQIAERRSKRLFRGLIKLEIPDIAAIIERLVGETDKSGRLGPIPLMRLAEIEGARQGFDRHRDWLILFKEDALRLNIYDFYKDLNSAIFDARALENFALTTAYQQNPNQYQHIVSTSRAQLTAKFRELAARSRDLAGRVGGLK